MIMKHVKRVRMPKQIQDVRTIYDFLYVDKSLQVILYDKIHGLSFICLFGFMLYTNYGDIRIIFYST